MTTRQTGIRVGAIAGILAISGLGAAPAATAATSGPDAVMRPMNWESSMSAVLTGFQSRRWADESYSEVRFKGCTTDNASASGSTTVELRWDRSLEPDVSWGSKTYTACFSGSDSVSAGAWTGITDGQQFFQIDKINGSDSGNSLTVQVVYIDTTEAD